jgi:MATE family multidrug resistance protein
VGHDPGTQNLEVIYFQIMCLGAGPVVAQAALAGFFSGQGRTGLVMIITVSGNIINIILNYILIFGHLGFPEMGVTGAAIATLIATLVTLFVFVIAAFGRDHETRFHVLSGWRPDVPLFVRLLRFGVPSGLQYFVIYISVSVFILLVGRLGTITLAATSIAFNINMLAFMPMAGFGMAVMILVGQYQGAKQPHLSEKSVYSGLHLTFIYMAVLAGSYVFAPGFFLWPFAIKADPASFGAIREITIVLLRFIALYCLFDTLSIAFASGIKGAGDTRFVMLMTFFLSLFGLAIPTYVVLDILHWGLYGAWSVFTAYIILLSLSFFMRFKGGKWRTMQVIDKARVIAAE